MNRIVFIKNFKKISVVVFFLCISTEFFGQSQRPKKHNRPSGKQHVVSLGANIPIGDFSSTHFPGVSAGYSWSNHRFGSMDVKPVRPVGFTAHGGTTWYFGKKETVSAYPYRYPKYLFIHAYCGAIYNPNRRANITITAGPALGLYNGHTQFNMGSILEGSYYFAEKIAVTPGIHFMKESGVNPLWVVSVKATLSF